MNLRLAEAEDRAFVIEMARMACTLDGRPVPSADAPAVVGLLPGAADVTVIAVDDDGELVGAAWWHIHDPPLIVDADDEPLPELAMAVVKHRRREGVGTALVEALARQAAQRYDALTLNVHLRNPAVGLYVQTGFRVAGAGRGWYGVTMMRSLQPDVASSHSKP
ncbi:MAG: GNAT family N-acetyltransferase [Chloroflexota bacterium]|nr:GNAT family N-acetyltransferase [Chloroflexota bacterium]